jgi:DHA1 family tetracycline resistance protein-like MFS transporter
VTSLTDLAPPGRSSRSERTSLAVVFVTLVIDTLGIGLMWPVLPMLVRELSGGNLASASSVYGWLVALYSLMQFGFGPALGALSDRFGRRPIMLLSLFGLGIDYLILAFAPDLWWVAGARIVGGVMGASISTCYAYVADITPAERRAQNFGVLGVAIGVGFVAGPFLGGVLGEYGSRVPFFAAIGVTAVAFVFAYSFLPESLSLENRRPFRLAEANPIGAVRFFARYPAIVALVVVVVLGNLGERLLESNWVLYSAYRYGWGPADVGISLAFFGVLFAIVQGGVVRVVVPRLGERRTLIMGLAVGAASLLLFGFASQGWMIYAVLVPYVLGWGNAGPAIQALLTRAVSPSEQGLLQGALASLTTATGVIAPPVGAGLFAFFIGPDTPIRFPGVAFVLGAVLFLIGLWLSSRRSFVAVATTSMG